MESHSNAQSCRASASVDAMMVTSPLPSRHEGASFDGARRLLWVQDHRLRRRRFLSCGLMMVDLRQRRRKGGFGFGSVGNLPLCTDEDLVEALPSRRRMR